MDLIRKLRQDLKKDGVGNNYLVQHTTGSGKSYSIGWLSHVLTSLYLAKGDTKRLFDTIIVVTDRKVLDDQLQETIKSLSKNEGVVHWAKKDSIQLKKFLEQGKTIIITTIQKFSVICEETAALGQKKFAVIIDEVHSSQSGKNAKNLNKTLSKTEEDEGEFDYEEMIRKEIQSRGKQPNISFFGFTGTPKEKTLELFGTKTNEGQFDPFHIYSMRQSIHEGFTLDVLKNYTTYKRYFKVKQLKDGDIEVPTGKGKQELVNYVDSHKMNIRQKVEIILDHWVNKGSKEIQGKSLGMIVTKSREICVLYFREINEQLKKLRLSYRCLVGFSGEVTINGKKNTESSCNLEIGYQGDVSIGLKDSKYRLLVVADKFQTGFDEPLMQSMYVDKTLKGVQCVQTLSRLNRKASGKTHTFVLDFVNEPKDIKESFQRFYQSTILECETDPNIIYNLQRKIFNFHLYTYEDVNRFCEIFYDKNCKAIKVHPILDQVVDNFERIEDEKTQEDFRSNVRTYIRMYEYISQIINFSDIELEKSFVFLLYLNKKLPKRQVDNFDISDLIELESFRMQKMHESMDGLVEEDSIIKPPGFAAKGATDPKYDFLSEIIRQLNKESGDTFTEEDRPGFSRIMDGLNGNHELAKIMKGDNTEDNKKSFFNQKFDGVVIDCINEHFNFYKKMDDNPLMKSLIRDLMYEGYKRELYGSIENEKSFERAVG